jgi:hypothetical protein
MARAFLFEVKDGGSMSFITAGSGGKKELNYGSANIGPHLIIYFSPLSRRICFTLCAAWVRFSA